MNTEAMIDAALQLIRTYDSLYGTYHVMSFQPTDLAYYAARLQPAPQPVYGWYRTLERTTWPRQGAPSVPAVPPIWRHVTSASPVQRAQRLRRRRVQGYRMTGAGSASSSA